MNSASSFFKRDGVQDFLQLLLFGICVIAGAILINTYVFRSFSVDGKSMQPTLQPADPLIVDRLLVTWQNIQGRQYVPSRGQIIVFKNPHYTFGRPDEYIVKRVIAFGGERVVLTNGKYTVYDSNNVRGFNPDDANHGEPGTPTAGNVDIVVPTGELFVSGDHRQLDAFGTPFSLDSRNGLGYVPLQDVVGPVSMRIYPFQSFRTF